MFTSDRQKNAVKSAFATTSRTIRSYRTAVETSSPYTFDRRGAYHALSAAFTLGLAVQTIVGGRLTAMRTRESSDPGEYCNVCLYAIDRERLAEPWPFYVQLKRDGICRQPKHVNIRTNHTRMLPNGVHSLNENQTDEKNKRKRTSSHGPQQSTPFVAGTRLDDAHNISIAVQLSVDEAVP